MKFIYTTQMNLLSFRGGLGVPFLIEFNMEIVTFHEIYFGSRQLMVIWLKLNMQS